MTSYIVASADDAPARDPKDWELVGSNDMQAWTVIDKKEGYVFPLGIRKCVSIPRIKRSTGIIVST